MEGRIGNRSSGSVCPGSGEFTSPSGGVKPPLVKITPTRRQPNRPEGMKRQGKAFPHLSPFGATCFLTATCKSDPSDCRSHTRRSWLSLSKTVRFEERERHNENKGAGGRISFVRPD